MRRSTDIELLRLLHGELPAERARELRARMERDPDLAAAYARLERTWSGLELPPAAPPPPGFRQRILARAPRPADARLSWAAAPVWVRGTAAGALVLGLALGAGVGRWTGGAKAAEATSGITASETVTETGLDLDFVNVYWDAIGSLDEGTGP